MKRREFIAGMAASLLSVKLHAAPSRPRFLLVFLRGGYDAANLLVPASGFYYESRPTIAVPREALLALDADWGLHPALRESVHPLYEARQAAFVPFAGTDDLSRSHFETQDSIELSLGAGSRAYGSGFMNRLAGVLGAQAKAISFTAQLPVAFRGEAAVANMALGSPRLPRVDARQRELIASMYKGGSLGEQVSEGFAAREQVMRELGDEMQAASRNAVNPRGFQAQARRIARLMQGDYNLGFVDVGGWDTHVGEGGAAGYLATRLEELGAGLAEFADAMGPVWRDTIVVVISEFGRTFRENGNRGTDHGHGTVYWVLGGAVRGGQIAGEQAKVERASLFQDRDYPVLNEYRALLGGLFARYYGLDAGQLGRVFPGVPARDLKLL
jgi:uncharacterized protein (DUF1501 family)